MKVFIVIYEYFLTLKVYSLYGEVNIMKIFTQKLYLPVEREQKLKEFEEQIEKMRSLLKEIYEEYGFSELVKIRNDLPTEIQEVIKDAENE